MLVAASPNSYSQQFNVVGSASQTSCECFQLTANTSWQGGSIWNLNQINLNNSFDYNFRVMLGCTDAQGADGICFVLQNTSVNVGGNGGGLGYMNFPNQSIGIEIDTYENSNYGDIAFDHIGMNSNGAINHNLVAPVQASATLVNIEDCVWHYFRVVWNSSNNSMQVYFDQILRFNYTFSGGLVNSIFNGNSNVYWGFTGATGLLFNLQQVCLNIQASFSAGNNYNSCSPSNIQFNDNSQTGLNNIVAYQWDFGDGTTSNQQNPLHSFPGPGTYNVSLTITDQSLCTQSINHVVTIFDPPQVNITTQDINCGIGTGAANLTINNGTAPFNVSVNSINAVLNSISANTFSITNLDAGSYTVAINDANNCSVGQNFNILQTTPPFADIVIMDAGCNGNSTGSITINPISGALPFLYSLNGQASQSNNTFNNLSAGNYAINIIDANACSLTQNVTIANTQVTVNPMSSFTMCSNTDTVVYAQATGGSLPYAYTFTNLNNGAIYNTNPLSIDIDATYSVYATDAAGCLSNVEQFSVAINPSPVINFTQGITTGCKPLCVTFEAVANQFNCSYQWLMGDQSSAHDSVVFHCYNESGTFDVLLKVTSSNGCITYLQKQDLIKVEELPFAYFSVTPEESSINLPKVSVYNYTDTALCKLWWDFGDNAPPREGFVNSYEYSDTGYFCIKLTAINTVGCADSAEKCVKINPEPSFYIPNSFTPNGDLLNDEFSAYGAHVENMNMYIYNRWGEQIFKHENAQEFIKWDGSNASQGVYSYVIEVNFDNKQSKTYTGAICLIR